MAIARPTAEQLGALVDCARGRRPPDLLIHNARVLRGYELQFRLADIAVVDGRIALVHDEIEPGPATETLDAEGGAVVPGYIETHGHPHNVYNPLTLATPLALGGVTTAVGDDFFLSQVLPLADMPAYYDAIACESAVRYRWSLRIEDADALDRVAALVGRDDVAQLGEIPPWPELVAGDRTFLGMIADALALHKRADGHIPGASYTTVSAVAAGGISADHEAITPEEVLDRLAAGVRPILRHSSLRPDLPELVKGLLARPEGEIAWEQLLLTTDGSSAPFLLGGTMDRAISILLDAGVPEGRAYSMATRNAAQYEGEESEIGVVAPRRRADLCVLPDARTPTPRHVVRDGQLTVRDGRVVAESTFDLSTFPFRPIPAHLGRLTAKRIEAGYDRLPDPVPVIHLESTAITRLHTVPKPRLTELRGTGLSLMLHHDRHRDALTVGLIDRFAADLPAMASTYGYSMGMLLAGTDVDSLVRTGARAADLGGGIVWAAPDEHIEVPLSLGGVMSHLPFGDVAERLQRLERAAAASGYPFHDVLYTLLFLAAGPLPDVRLLPEGIVSVKDRTVVVRADA